VTPGRNPHLANRPVPAGVPLSEARMAAVLIHGRDQDEQVMLDVAERLALPDVAYLLPVAAGNTWYAGRYFDPVADNQPQVDWALETYEAALATVAQAGVDERRTVLAGFSQGACLVAELMARRPRPLAGAAVLTGTLLGPAGQRVTPAPADGLPMLFAASRHDDWIEFADAEATAVAFEQAGAQVTFEAYEDRVHHVSDAAVSALRPLFTTGS
jgi:phospholipase/carboxylesterase